MSSALPQFPGVESITPAATLKKKSDQQKKTLLATPAATPPPQHDVPITVTRGEPVAALTTHDVYMPIKDVNKKVAEITDAHQKTMGYAPTPNLVFDLLRSDQHLQKAGITYDQLFKDTPQTARDATVSSVASTVGDDGLASQDPLKQKLARKAFFDQTMKDVHSGLLDEHGGALKLQAAGWPDSLNPFVASKGIVGLWGEQVLQSVTNLPFGLYTIGKAAVHDTTDLSTYPLHYAWYPYQKTLGVPLGAVGVKAPEIKTRKPAFETATLGKLMAEQIWMDVTHADKYPGYLTLDAFAAYSAGAGTAARLGAASRVAAAGEGAGAVAKALITRPAPGSYEFGLTGYNENVNFFDNAGARIIQKGFLKLGEKRLRTHQLNVDEEKTPLYDMILHPERKLKRATERRMALEYAVQMSPVVEMTRLSRWQAVAAGAWKEMLKDKTLNIKQLTNSQQEGMQRAILLLFTDDHDPIGVWRGHHDRSITDLQTKKADLDQKVTDAADLQGDDFEEAVGIPKDEVKQAGRTLDYMISAHKAQLDVLKLGEGILANPPKRLVPLYNAALDVEARMTNIQKTILGLDDRTAEQHVANMAAQLRGEETAFDPEIGHYLIPKDAEKYQELQANLDTAQKALEKERKKLTTLERSLAKPTKTGKTAERPALKLRLDAQQMRVRQAEGDFRIASGRAENVPEPIPQPLTRRITGEENYQIIYHGTPFAFKDFSSEAATGEVSAYGPGVYFSTLRDRAEGYADQALVGPHRAAARTNNAEVAPQVHIRQVDESKLLDIFSQSAFEAAKEKLATALTSEQMDAISGAKTTRDLYRGVVGLGSRAEANQILARAGFDGIKAMDEIIIFDPKSVLPGFDSEALSNLREIRQGQGSGYNPMRREIYRMGERVSGSRFRPKRGKYGLAPPEKPANQVRSDGTALEMGDYSWDTTGILAETYSHVVRAAAAVVLHQNLFKLTKDGGPASLELTGYHTLPIRDIRDASESLKEVAAALERRVVRPKDAEKISSEQMQNLRKYMYPTDAELSEMTAAEKGHVRYVDPHLVPERFGFDAQTWQAIDRGMSKAFGLINEPWRLALIFATPAYALNALGSAAMLTARQGFLAPANYGRAIASHHIYGGQMTRIFDTLAGNTHSRSYLPGAEGKSKWALGSRAFMEGWQKITDTQFRRAAVIYELRRRGLLRDGKSPEELVQQFLSDDPEIKKAIGEASEASRNSMLNFNTMTWPEKAILSHLFFIYSFMRAGAVYGAHWLVEHPIQHTVLAQAGREREKAIKDLIGETPLWFDRQGYVPIAPGKVLNPIQINMPSVLSQLAYPAEAMFSDTPYSSPEDLLGGGSQFVYQMLTNKDSSGQDLPNANIPFGHGRIAGSFLSLLRQTPVGYALQRAGKLEKQKEKPLPPNQVASSATNPTIAALRRERAALNQSPFELDGFWNNWGLLIGRTAVPKETNEEALAARHWRDTKINDPKAYTSHELDAVNKMVDRQQAAVGSPAPQGVRDAVKMVSRWSIHMHEFVQKSGLAKPNARMLYAETVRFLKADGKLADPEYKKLMADVRFTTDPRDARTRMISALWGHGGRDWQQWVEKVNRVDWFAQDKYVNTVTNLKELKLGNYTDSTKVSKDAKWEYGREAVKFADKHAELLKQADTLTGHPREYALAKLRSFENEHVQPVTIHGTQFPPLYAVAGSNSYGRLTTQGRQDWFVSRANRSFGSLNSFEKKVLTGKDSDPSAAQGWLTLSRWLSESAAKLDVGEKLPSGIKKFYGDSIAAKSPAFKAEWEFSQKPLAARLSRYVPIQKSKYVDQWNTLLAGAAGWAQRYRSGGWPWNPLAQAWERDGVPKLKAWIAEQPAGFRSELKSYEDTNSRFLVSLVKP